MVPCEGVGQLGLQHCNLCNLLSGFPSKVQSFMTVIHSQNVRTHNIPKVDELNINWDDNIWRLIHKKFF